MFQQSNEMLIAFFKTAFPKYMEKDVRQDMDRFAGEYLTKGL